MYNADTSLHSTCQKLAAVSKLDAVQQLYNRF